MEPIQKRSLVDMATATLRQQIESGAWPTAMRVPPEAQLAKLLGIGRNTVREAVRGLAQAGMLEVRQGDGTYVRATYDGQAALHALNRAALHDQLEVRRALEVEAAKLAAIRRTTADLQAMRKALAARGDWEDGGDLAAFVERDAEFHRSIVAASHNEALVELYRYFWSSVQSTIARTEDQPGIPEPTLAAHQAIFLAIERGDAASAAAAAHQLLTPAIEAISRSAC